MALRRSSPPGLRLRLGRPGAQVRPEVPLGPDGAQGAAAAGHRGGCGAAFRLGGGSQSGRRQLARHFEMAKVHASL